MRVHVDDERAKGNACDEPDDLALRIPHRIRSLDLVLSTLLEHANLNNPSKYKAPSTKYA